MSKNLSSLDLAKKVLEESNSPLSALEIWEKAQEIGLADKSTLQWKNTS